MTWSLVMRQVGRFLLLLFGFIFSIAGGLSAWATLSVDRGFWATAVGGAMFVALILVGLCFVRAGREFGAQATDAVAETED